MAFSHAQTESFPATMQLEIQNGAEAFLYDPDTSPLKLMLSGLSVRSDGPLSLEEGCAPEAGFCLSQRGPETALLRVGTFIIARRYQVATGAS